MTERRVHLIIPLALILLPQTAFTQPTPNAMSVPQITQAASQICQQPTLYGYKRGTSGELSGKLNLPKLTSLLADLGVSANLKGNAADWNGIAQADAAGAVRDGNACRERMFTLMFSYFYVSVTTPPHITLPRNPPPAPSLRSPSSYNGPRLPPYPQRTSWTGQLVGCNVNAVKFEKIDNYLRRELNFSSFIEAINNSKRSYFAGFAQTSTVLYYHQQVEPARALAKILEARFGEHFAVQAGANIDYPATHLVVHWISEGC